MLDNTRRGFIEEIVLIFASMTIFTVIVIWIEYVYSYYAYSLVQDAITLFILSFFVFFPMVHLIRYAFVYRAYPILYIPYILFSTLLIFIGADTAKYLSSGSPKGFSSLMIVLSIVIATLLYTAWIYKLKKRDVFKKSSPPERVDVVRALLTPKQKLTLVFPDRYVRYLETGDEKYLKEGEKS